MGTNVREQHQGNLSWTWEDMLTLQTLPFPWSCSPHGMTHAGAWSFIEPGCDFISLLENMNDSTFIFYRGLHSFDFSIVVKIHFTNHVLRATVKPFKFRNCELVSKQNVMLLVKDRAQLTCDWMWCFFLSLRHTGCKHWDRSICHYNKPLFIIYCYNVYGFVWHGESIQALLPHRQTSPFT